jgi:hypothetical protein
VRVAKYIVYESKLEQVLNEVTAKLNLDAEQRQMTKTFLQWEKEEVDAVKKDGSLTAEQRDAKLNKIKRKRWGDINSILDSDQKAKLKQWNQEVKQKRGLSADSNGP